ncbi:MAG: hypothetical protein LBI94_04395 [Treponema sp.]|jgi:hypothetical protein|nr:hypothetical protein [Treponema sp.]
MRKKKPFRVLEERLKYNYIVIELFKRRKIFSFGLSTSIGDGGIGHPEQGTYRSYFEAKNAALHRVVDCHKSPLQHAILRKFRLMNDLDQPLLFDDM